jgi:predicted nucleotidyltransferase
MGMPDIDIDAAEWEIVRNILHAHVPDCEVWAFGSRARRQARRHSDLDIVVIPPPPMAPGARAALAEAFTESDLNWKVDVLDWAETGAAFRAVMARDRVVLQRGGERGSGPTGPSGFGQNQL